MQGPLTYIVSNCIMQRDSQASCSPLAAQMGEAFPGSFCMPPAEQRAGPGVRCEHFQPAAGTDRHGLAAGHCAPSGRKST